MSGPNVIPLIKNLLNNTHDTTMTVIMIKVLPIKNVNENFEIFLTQAIGIKMHIKIPPIISA
jgi:hypothetical protein